MTAITLAVAGHTNVGKTSLMRTLLKDINFGEVSNKPSTTRHVEGAELRIDTDVALQLFDTPGMEDAIALLAYMDQLVGHQRMDGPHRIQLFLDSPEAHQRFEQEAKVLRQLLRCDAALYVIDAREPVLAKYKDELHVLSFCGKPLLPVLNFITASVHHEKVWRDAMSRLGLHAAVCFDAHIIHFDAEQRLYQSLALLLESRRPTLEALIASRQSDAAARDHAARLLIANLMIDCAAYRRQVSQDESFIQQGISDMHQAIRVSEQKCVESLLQLYAFHEKDAALEQLPLLNGRWGDDLFNPETLKQLGVRVGGGMAAGAATGLSLDLLAGGATLGGAALVGALLGGGIQTARNYRERLSGKFKGVKELTVDDAILRLLGLRQHQLYQALITRGHATQQPVHLELPHAKSWQEGTLPKPLLKARAHPEWSSIIYPSKASSADRQAQAQVLAESFNI